MDLTGLFETQLLLDAEIEQKHQTKRIDRLDKKFLALFTEIGECANEWRGFKFWSMDQEARTIDKKVVYDPNPENPQSAKFVRTNPLLEEYVDAIHFLLSLGNEFGYEKVNFQQELIEYHEVGTTFKERNVTRQFNNVFNMAIEFEDTRDETEYIELVLVYIALGEMLGFTWEQIEEAYMSKNKTNWERQANGY